VLFCLPSGCQIVKPRTPRSYLMRVLEAQRRSTTVSCRVSGSAKRYFKRIGAETIQEFVEIICSTYPPRKSQWCGRALKSEQRIDSEQALHMWKGSAVDELASCSSSPLTYQPHNGVGTACCALFQHTAERDRHDVLPAIAFVLGATSEI
jgi:hypothetical protein